MLKKLFNFYKIPLLISLVLSIVLVALSPSRPVLDYTQLFLGAFLGSFFLDIEFFIYAYLFEPSADFSKTLLGFVKHRDFANAFLYLNYHKDEVKDKSINSAIFQIVMALLSISIIFATTFVFIKALVLSIFANTMYKFAEAYFKGPSDEWFWALKNKPTKNGVIAYAVGLVLVLLFCLAVYR